MKSLKLLWLYSNDIVEIPKEIKNLQNLEELVLDDNRIEKVPEEVFECKKITKLYLSDNYLTAIPKSILNLTEMIELLLSENEEWEEFPLEMLNLPKLQKVEVDSRTYDRYDLSNHEHASKVIIY